MIYNYPMDVFKALSEPTRRSIVALLAGRERSAGEITQHFTISAPAVSQHLKALREARLVQVRVDAQRRLYSLDRRGVGEVDAWVREMSRFWSDRLDALAEQLAESQESETGGTHHE